MVKLAASVHLNAFCKSDKPHSEHGPSNKVCQTFRARIVGVTLVVSVIKLGQASSDNVAGFVAEVMNSGCAALKLRMRQHTERFRIGPPYR